jgi:hypothetical protein
MFNRHDRSLSCTLAAVLVVACGDAAVQERDAAVQERGDASRDASDDDGDGADGALESEDFECAGLQLTIPASKRCDGVIDCRRSAFSSNRDNGSDERDCEGSFFCPDIGASGRGARVIPLEKVCDGRGDCDLAEDEHDCPELDNHFCDATDEGLTLVYSADEICDGSVHCYWAEDERDCPNSSLFLCPTFLGPGLDAIPIAKRCDGSWDCTIDEFDCPGVESFVCSNGATIPLANKCDQISHCGSDESEDACPGQVSCSTPYLDTHPTISRELLEETKSPQFVAANKRCDGVRDCARGDDEENCDPP